VSAEPTGPVGSAAPDDAADPTGLVDGSGQRDGHARRWLRVVPGATLVLVVLAVAARTWSALLANHPAYPLTLAAAFVAGLALVVTGLRRRPRAPAGAVRTVLRVLGSAAGLGAAALLLWLMPFLAEPVALDALRGSDQVTVTDGRTATVYSPAGEPRSGLVLVPGARVDPRAYAVLASRIAAEGHEVVVVKCPFDLELLCPDAPAGFVTEDMPWVVGGHSLGGVVAAAYAGRDSEVDGLVLWASYPLQDISDREALVVASVSAGNDGFSTPAKVDERMPLLPADTERVEIAGAIHSFFGDYGIQPGDGVASVSREEAQDQIVAATLALLDRAAGGTAD
jgi:hypothetical protein